MRENIEVNEVLSRLKSELNIKKDIELAGFLDIMPDILETWKERNSIDSKHLISKCMENGIKLNKVFEHGQSEKIIETTLELFMEKGHAETSIDYIAQKAGLSKEAVHEYYDNKI